MAAVDEDPNGRDEIAQELRRIRDRLDELERSEREIETAYAALAQLEMRFRALVENAYDLCAELDEKGVFTWLSPNASEALGWSSEELIGSFALDRVHPDDLERCAAGLAQVLEHGRSKQYAYRFQARTGEWLWFETSSTAYRDAEGELRILAVSRDVTEQRRHLEDREQALREKEDALARVRVLSGLLPICTHCRRVRDDEGYWRTLEIYVSNHSNAVFSHSLCEACLREHYGDVLDGDD